MPITIYGIKNCDTMKKARAWLDDHGVACAFHDYKTAGIGRAQLEGLRHPGCVRAALARVRELSAAADGGDRG